jgi:hypothetical protein
MLSLNLVQYNMVDYIFNSETELTVVSAGTGVGKLISNFVGGKSITQTTPSTGKFISNFKGAMHVAPTAAGIDDTPSQVWVG